MLKAKYPREKYLARIASFLQDLHSCKFHVMLPCKFLVSELVILQENKTLIKFLQDTCKFMHMLKYIYIYIYIHNYIYIIPYSGKVCWGESLAN